jgi:group I intron endonuclease
MLWCLYTITNQVNGKQYIGISSRVARRWIEHKSGHGSKLVYQAIKKYGLDALKFDIFCEGCEEDIKKLEVAMIETCNTLAPNGYNLTLGGEGSLGWKPSKETRRKMSAAHSGEGNAMFGKKHSEETRRKLSEKAKGRKNPSRNLMNLECTGAANPRARRVLVEGVEYGCMKDAAEAIGIKPSTLRQRMTRWEKRAAGLPSGWRYLDI